MKIYEVSRNYTACDSDAWNYWVAKDVISHHLTVELAEKKVKSLILTEIANLEKEKDIPSPMLWLKKLKVLESNIVLGDVTNEIKDYNLFEITPINVEE